MARPRPIIIPGPGGLGSQTQATQIDFPLTDILKLVGQRKEAEQEQQQEQALLGNVLSVLGTPAGAFLEPGAEGPPTPIIPPDPQQQAAARAAVQLAPKEVGKELTGFLFPEPTAPPQIFSPADITKFTRKSVARAEKSNLRSDLELRPEVLNKIAGRGGGDIANREGNLRKEFTGLSKTFRDVRDSFARVQESAKEPSAAGDLALIFNFMKMLDPGSVVRESEFATAQNAAGIPERIRAQYNRALEGERLSPKTRKDFTNRAGQLFKRQDAQHKRRVETFTGIARRNRLNIKNVVIDLGDPILDIEAEIQALEERQ